MKQWVVMAAFVLCAMPGTAMAQKWQFSTKNGGDECFAMTHRGDISIGFQAPNGDRAGGIAVLAPDDAGAADAVITISAPGKLAGDHPAKVQNASGVNAFFLRVETLGDFDSLPDSWHVKMVMGNTTVVDTDISGFRGALATVQKCVADR